MTDCKAEKKSILHGLIDAEKLITFGTSDDFDRYTKMGLQIEPNDIGFLARNRNFMAHIMQKILYNLYCITDPNHSNMAELFDANFLKNSFKIRPFYHKGGASFVFTKTIWALCFLSFPCKVERRGWSKSNTIFLGQKKITATSICSKRHMKKRNDL